MPNTHPKLGVVVPMANEQATVDAFLAAVLIQLGAGDVVFCVLDNASKDSTRQHVEAYAKQDPRIILVWSPENRSVVDAYFRGYREALANGCEWILEMDAGMSHDPREIPRFLEAMSQDIDFAAGSRFVRGGSHRGSFSRYVISKGGTLLACWLLGSQMKDMTSGFQCFTRDALEHVVRQGVRSRAHFFQTEIRHMLKDWKWTEVPICYCMPSKSVGRDAIADALRNLWQLRRECRSTGENTRK